MDEALMKFWEAERRAPRWLRQSNETDKYTAEENVEWAKQHKVYFLADGRAALFAAPSGEIHFSILADASLENLTVELEEVKADLLTSGVKVIFGWVLRQNRGLRSVCEQLGMRFSGLRRFKSFSHGRVCEWYCYQLFPTQEIVAPPIENVLSLQVTE